MTALSTGTLKAALYALGRDPERRARVIAMLRAQEAGLAVPGLNVREEITGPIVDALHAEGELISRTLTSGLTIAFPYRSKIARDFVIASDDGLDHVWEPQTTKLLLSLGRTAKTALIGGAYFGDHAIPLAHVMRGAGGVCHCFDLNAEQIGVLAQNARANGLENVVTNQVGLWHEDDRRLVLVGDDSHALSREATAEELAAATATISIDSYGRARGLASIDIIMLDIEGAEVSALAGAGSYLSMPAASAPSVIFEVHRAYVDWSDGLGRTPIVELLRRAGYHVFAVRDYQSNVDMRGRPVEVVPIDDIYLDGPPHGFNVFATKDPRVLADHGIVVTPGVSPKLLFHRDPRFHSPLH